MRHLSSVWFSKQRIVRAAGKDWRGESESNQKVWKRISPVTAAAAADHGWIVTKTIFVTVLCGPHAGLGGYFWVVAGQRGFPAYRFWFHLCLHGFGYPGAARRGPSSTLRGLHASDRGFARHSCALDRVGFVSRWLPVGCSGRGNDRDHPYERGSPVAAAGKHSGNHGDEGSRKTALPGGGIDGDSWVEAPGSVGASASGRACRNNNNVCFCRVRCRERRRSQSDSGRSSYRRVVRLWPKFLKSSRSSSFSRMLMGYCHVHWQPRKSNGYATGYWALKPVFLRMLIRVRQQTRKVKFTTGGRKCLPDRYRRCWLRGRSDAGGCTFLAKTSRRCAIVAIDSLTGRFR